MLAACSKKDNYVYPTKPYVEYSNTFLAHFKDYRLFTKDGEIYDRALVSAYAKGYEQYFYYPGASFNDPDYKLFSMLNEDSIFNISRSPIAELKRTATGVYDIYTSRFQVPVNDTNALFLHLGQYPLFEMATTPDGYRYAELHNPAYILKKVGDSLFFPMMRYIITSQRDYSFSFTADKLNNVFSLSGINKLKAYDTLLVQSFDVGLVRKK